MKKLLTALLMASILLTTACGAQTPAKSEVTTEAISSKAPESEASSESETSDSYYPITIDTYNSNDEVVTLTINEMPTKVYTMGQNNIEAMLALGIAENIEVCYGLDTEIDPEYADEFAKVTFLEDGFTGLPKEDVIALQPDFILTWSSIFIDERLGSTDYWHENGINSYISLNSGARPSGTPQKMEDEMQDILNIGKIFNKQAEAEALVAEITDEIAKIKAHIAKAEPIKIAVLEDEGGNFRVYGANTLGGDIAINAGATLAIGAEDSADIGAEDLIVANPEMIFMVWYEGYITPEEAVASITENPAYASLDAVQNGKVYPLNLTNIYCSGLRTMDGVLEFAQAMYPDMYN